MKWHNNLLLDQQAVVVIVFWARCVLPIQSTSLVADGEVGGCVDPEGNGFTMGRGAEGGPGPPSGGQDKQLICYSGGGETPMGEQGGQQDRYDHQELIMHGVHKIVK